MNVFEGQETLEPLHTARVNVNGINDENKG